MKFTLAWLKDYLETDATAETIAARLTALGFEVEELRDPGAALMGFTVAHIKETRPHPNADRLKLCTVDIGGQVVEVVCGAPNARAGLKTAYAREGVVIPRSGTALKASTIRGVVSNGMLCSESELQLPETVDGIMELPENAAVGAALPGALGLNDWVFTIKLTPNRPDGTGVYGLARDLAAAGLGTLRPLNAPAIAGQDAGRVKVVLETPICPYFVGLEIRGVQNGDSPAWLQQRLTAVGLRPISALVDITNYISYAYGRPLHVFDADKIQGALRVRESRAGESFVALNGETYTLAAGHAVLADDTGVLGLAGVMGGASSGCTAATKTVFIEVAYFSPAAIARAGRAINLTSDARYRFERGVDPAFLPAGAALAAQMVLELCGGAPCAGVSVGAEPSWQRSIPLRATRCASLGGMDVDAAEQQKILSALGFSVEQTGTDFQVQPPSWRPDILGEADLVEEILRLKGYDALVPVPLPPLPRPPAALLPAPARASQVRRALAAAGLLECVSYSFMPQALAETFGGAPAALRLVNPISDQLDQLRPSVLPNLMLAAKRNADRGFPDAALFEVGPIYKGPGETEQLLVAAIVRQGASARHWHAPARPVDAFDAKADALMALQAAGLNVSGVTVTSGAPAHFHPGQAARLMLGPLCLGVFGALHPALAQTLDNPHPLVMAEIFLDAIPVQKRKSFTRPALAEQPLQPLHRDFAFLVDAQVSAEALTAAARGADRALIAAAAIFDVYQGKGIPAGQKSVALGVTLQPGSKTLTDTEIAALCAKIIAAVTKATGASLRTA